MADTILGKVVFTPKGAYSNTATYYKLDCVSYNNKAWACKVDNTKGITPTSGANWELLVEGSGGGSGASTWSEVANKPFESIDNDTLVNENGVLKASVSTPIDDTTTATDKVWSSEKTNTEITSVSDKVAQQYELGYLGGNLFDIDKPFSTVPSVVVSDNAIVVTNSDYASTQYSIDVEVNEPYTLGFNASSIGGKGCAIYIKEANGGGTILASKDITENGEYELTFTSSKDVVRIQFCGRGTTSSGVLSNIRINKGTTALPYSPYSESNVALTDKVDSIYEDGFASKNLFDGRYEDGSINASGVEQDTDGFGRTMPIYVKPNTTYTTLNLGVNGTNTRIHAYTSNGTWISQLREGDQDTPFITPSNCAYIRISTRKTLLDDKPMVAEGSAIEKYMPYADSNVALTDKVNAVEDTLTFNSIDIKNYVVNGLNGYLTQNGTLNSNDSWKTSDFISAKGIVNVEFIDVVGSAPAICFYDKNKKYISGEQYSSRLNFKVALPNGTNYIRYSMTTSDFADISKTVVAKTIRSLTEELATKDIASQITTSNGTVKSALKSGNVINISMGVNKGATDNTLIGNINSEYKPKTERRGLVTRNETIYGSFYINPTNGNIHFYQSNSSATPNEGFFDVTYII